MGIEDHVLLGYTPVGYTADSDLVEDHIAGIDAELTIIKAGASVLTGRPGDNLDKTPDIAALTAQSIPTPLVYHGLNFDQEDEVEPGDSDHFLLGDALYLPYNCRNARASLAAPLGAASTNVGEVLGLVNPQVHPTHAIVGDMTFLCMTALGRRINPTVDLHLMEFGSWTSIAEIGVATRMPYRLKFANNAAKTGSQSRDRVLEYSHFDSGDAEIIATAKYGDVGVGIPTGPEYGIGYTRSVGASTEVKFYVNGSQAGDTVSGLANPGAAGNSVTMTLHYGGKHANTAEYLGGTFRAFAIWNSILTPAQINAFYELCVGKI